MHRSGGAKFTPPRSGKVLPRPRVFSHIDAVPLPGAIWIAGPPGSGKSTLVASYADHAGLPSLWYQVDAGDLDVGAFFHDLAVLVRDYAPRAYRRLPRFTPEARLGLAVYARRFFRELFAELRNPFLLAFDNLQELPRDAPLCAALAQAIEELPASGRMALVSRYAAPPCLARLHASRRLHALEDQALALTRSETRDLAQLLLGKPVATDFAERLHTVSEGWMAGVILLLECSRTGHGDRPDLPALQATVAFDYFASEIFARLAPPARHCLLKLSLLPAVRSMTAERICGSPAVHTLLAELHASNCFVSLHSSPQPVYQFHSLFREFLQARALAVFSPEEWREVQVRAAALLEEEGRLDDAVRLYASASEWGEVVRLVLTHAPTLAGRRQLQTLDDWLASLPAAVAHADPWLLYWQGVSALFGRPGAARTSFEAAYEGFAEQADGLGRALSSAGVIDAMLYEMGPSNRVDPWIMELEESLHRATGFPSPEVEARALISLFSAAMIREPGHPRMPSTEERLLAVAGKIEEVDLRLRAEHDVAWYRIFRGDMHRAFALTQVTAERVRDAKPGPMGAITQHAIETWFAMLAGEHERCLAASAQALALARESGIHIWTPQVLGNSLASAIAAGDTDAVTRISSEYVALPLDRRPVDLAYQQCLLAWRYAAEGDHTLALRHQTVALDTAEQIGMPFLIGLGHLGLTHVLLARGDRSGAEQHLTLAHDVALRAKLDVLAFPCLLARAHLALSGGDRAQGVDVLRAAFAMGRTQGYRNAYWWEPTWAGELAEQALRAGIEVPYVQDLVRRRGLAPRAPPVDCPAWPWRVKLYTLGRLQLLVDDRAVRFEGKAQRRPLELLLGVVAFRGRAVPEERLFEALWAGSEPDKAYASMKMTLARLRELLGDTNAIRLSNGCLTLDARRCWVDSWEFERRLSGAESMLPSGDVEGAHRALEAAMALYRGPFLQADTTSPWSIELRERLRARLLRAVASVGEALVEAGEDTCAVHLHERALEADALAEALYLGLIRIHDRLGRRPEAIEAYERCRRVLASHGLTVSHETEAVRRTL